VSALGDWVERWRSAAQLIAGKYVLDDPGKGLAMKRPSASIPSRRATKGPAALLMPLTSCA
jgi:hypothetical protein